MAATKEEVRTMIDELSEEQVEAVHEYLEKLVDTEKMEHAKDEGEDGPHEQDSKTKAADVSVTDDLAHRDRGGDSER
ncbi:MULTISPECIES: hypothetical protein [Alteribacter]|uniref:Uncharacterized protein n=1 Tax=Alteribacter keqinensis TaxID=2483800 RepID=A0A3M7TQ68_9BACI|nr:MULTISPECIES: hypothetical protein [Alteribacter]MBM7095026.1 hypothetical protein [Alteribacter salitolerans]RNA66819.1 hypothetical protein EBO34_16565 [Alteribacter keqinensis]